MDKERAEAGDPAAQRQVKPHQLLDGTVVEILKRTAFRRVLFKESVPVNAAAPCSGGACPLESLNSWEPPCFVVTETFPAQAENSEGDMGNLRCFFPRLAKSSSVCFSGRMRYTRQQLISTLSRFVPAEAREIGKRAGLLGLSVCLPLCMYGDAADCWFTGGTIDKMEAEPGTRCLRLRGSSRKARPPGTATTLTESLRPREKSTIRTRPPAPTRSCPCRPEYGSRTCATAEAWCCASMTAALSWPTAWSISPARGPDGLASRTPESRVSASRPCPDDRKNAFFPKSLDRNGPQA